MKRALLLAAFTAAACSNTVILGSGQFVAPTGLAVVPAADRDLIFVAGTGRDGLRALEICEGINSDDNVTNTCPEDLQFVPGPIRVFPANVETNDRPLQLAGAWLNLPVPALPDGGPAPVTPQGVVLVVGANKSVRFVDAKNLLDATAGDAGLTEPLTLPIDGIAADVVADNIYDPNDDTLVTSTSVDAFVVTVPTGTTPAELIGFTVTLDPVTGAATQPSNIRKCTLDGVVPSRIAVSPNQAAPSPNQPNSCGTLTSCIPHPPAAPTSDIFVGDGAPGHDGAVRVARSSLVPVASGETASPSSCAMTRISAGGHAVRALKLSPQWYETVNVPALPDPALADAGVTLEPVTTNHPAGELLMMVLKPDETPRPGFPFNSGGVIFVDLCTYNPPIDTFLIPGILEIPANPDAGTPKVPGVPGVSANPPNFVAGDTGHCKDFDGGVIVPIPPARYDAFSPGILPASPPPVQAMEPIAPNGLAQDAVFLRASRPETTGVACPNDDCTLVYVAVGNNPLENFFLVAAVTSSDGSTYFVDVVRRRFINANFFNLVNDLTSVNPLLTLAPTLVPPADPSATPPTLLFATADSVHTLTGWLNPGVTHTQINWRVVWHGVFPGLDHLGGTITPSGRGTMFFDASNTSPDAGVPDAFAAAQADPILQFTGGVNGAGDNVGFLNYAIGSDNSAACQTLVSTENLEPVAFEASVIAIHPDGVKGRLELAGLQSIGFNPNDACTSFVVTAEFHTGGARPWLVYDGSTILGRAPQGDAPDGGPGFIAMEPRFDYPADYDPTNSGAFPVIANDIALAFSLIGDQPTFPGSEFIFSVVSNLLQVLYNDSAVFNGFATGVIPYTSFNHFGVIANIANPNAVFTAVTGADSLIMATPSLLSASQIGLRVFR